MPLIPAFPEHADLADIDAFLASEREPELARMHIARAPGDLDPARAPAFVRDFLDYAFAQRPTG